MKVEGKFLQQVDNGDNKTPGVFYHNDIKSWVPQAVINGYVVFLGLHETKEGADKAYDSWLKEYFHEFWETAR